MTMHLSKIKIDGVTAIRVNIRKYTNDDIPALDVIGITELETGMSAYRYAICHTPEELERVRGAVLDAYAIIATDGGTVRLSAK